MDLCFWVGGPRLLVSRASEEDEIQTQTEVEVEEVEWLDLATIN